MIKVLANDGIDAAGKLYLEQNGFQVDTNNVPQDQLPQKLDSYEAILVRSATTVRKELIDICPNLKLIGRGGVGMDNIDVAYAREKGLKVINTPAASSNSVAELVFTHIFNLSRFVHLSNREMPVKGANSFGDLKKNYSKGMELNGKKIGIIGFGRIGQEVAKKAIGLNMSVAYSDIQPFGDSIEISLGGNGQKAQAKVSMLPLEDLLKSCDIVSVHVPKQANGKALIGKKELESMKRGAVLVNCARGGVIDENALLEALDSGHLRGVGLDVFENEPKPNEKLLNHPGISVTPHIGASTGEAQERVGLELAEQMIQYFKELKN